MALLPLPPQVVSHIRSGVSLVSPSQCLAELILNSIDADATNVVTHLDLSCHKMQVKDNGVGMTYDQLKVVGERYCTNKCSSVNDLNNLRSYGYRGEALASLKEISRVMEIVSRTSCGKTFCKLFTEGEAKGVTKSSANREQNGTTVTVIDFMYNLPVRKKMISETLDLEHCRNTLARIALIHPHISFVLHNDATEEIILQTHKSKSILASFVTLFGQKKAEQLKAVQYTLSSYTISGYVSLDSHTTKDLQFLYVNNHVVLKTKLHKIVNSLLKKYLLVYHRIPSHNSSPNKSMAALSQDRHGIFILNIRCPSNSYDLCLEPKKSLIEFKEWIKVLNLIEKCICGFLKDNNIAVEESEICNDLFSPFAGNIAYGDEQEINTYNTKNALFSLVAKRDKMDDEKTNYILNQEIGGKDCVEVVSNMENCGKVKMPNEASYREDELLHGMSQSTVGVLYDDNTSFTKNKSPHRDHAKEFSNKNIRSTLTAFKWKTKEKEVVSSQISPKEKHKFITVGKRVIRLPTVMKPYYMKNSLHQLKSAKESKFTKLKTPHGNKRTSCRTAQHKLHFSEALYIPHLKNMFNSFNNVNDNQEFFNTDTAASRKRRGRRCNLQTSQMNKTNKETEHTSLETESSSATEIDHMPSIIEQSVSIPLSVDVVQPSQRPNLRSQKYPYSQYSPDSVILAIEKSSDKSYFSPPLKWKLRANKSNQHSELAKMTCDSAQGKTEFMDNSMHLQIGEPTDILEERTCNFQVPFYQIAEKPGLLDETCSSCQDVSGIHEKGKTDEESFSNGTTKDSLEGIYMLPAAKNDESVRSDPFSAAPIVGKKFAKIKLSPFSNEERLKEKLWICHRDEVSGKCVYVNSINANSSYCHPEAETSGGLNANLSENSTRSHFFLSHNSTPFLPRPSLERNSIWTKLKSKSLLQSDDNSSFCQLQLTSSNNDKTEVNINDMYQKWKNPVFQKQDMKEIIDISLKQFAKREVKVYNLTQPHNLSRSELDIAKVIGQVDSKFIACLVPKSNKSLEAGDFIVLFDQHAVHERIRLEQLIKGLYEENANVQRIRLSSLDTEVNIKLRPEELRIIKAYHNELNKLGFQLHFNDQNSAIVNTVPSCLLEKEVVEPKKGKLPTTSVVIQTIIKEWIQMLQETGVATSLPKTLLSVLNSQACHGAIKFGDHLEKTECSKLIKMLTSCKLPFQCAHGRPSLVPLVDLSSFTSSECKMAKPQLWKLVKR